MSSLPLISHRMFAAALGTEESAPMKASGDQEGSLNSASAASAVALEVLEYTQPMPNLAARSLRAAVPAAMYG